MQYRATLAKSSSKDRWRWSKVLVHVHLYPLQLLFLRDYEKRSFLDTASVLLFHFSILTCRIIVHMSIPHELAPQVTTLNAW